MKLLPVIELKSLQKETVGMDDVDDRPIWAEVLRVLYDETGGPRWGMAEQNEKERTEMISKALDRRDVEVDQHGIHVTLHRMAEVGLVDKEGTETRPPFTLTSKGFDVAHERQREEQRVKREKRRDKRQHEVNRGVGFLTLGLVFVGIIQAGVVALTDTHSPLWQVYGILMVGIVIVIGLFFWIQQTGMLASWNAEEWRNA